MVVSERKSDILTNLLMEASAEYEQTLNKVTISEANFRAVYENAPEAIYIIDIQIHQILDCNPFMLQWLGYDREEIIGQPVEFILEPGAQNIDENIQKAVVEGQAHSIERCYQKKDGTVVDAEINGTLVDYQGEKCFFALVRDVTERKKNEELYRYKELFKNVSDPMFINDARGRFLEINDVACDCFGYSRDEFMEMSLKDLTWTGHWEVLAEMSKNIREGETYQFEMDMMTQTGIRIPFEFQGRVIYYVNKAAFLSVARDLSYRRKMQETLIKTERLSAVGEMASGVAHNFNNLLQMIIVAGEAALSKLDSGQIRTCREAVENILTAAHRGAGVVRRIKDFTIGKSDEIETARDFDLNKLIGEAIQLTKPLWNDLSTPQKYQLNFFKRDECLVCGKSSDIYEVLVNLIKNALEAMPRGGALTLSTGVREGKIHLTVADTGHGIKPENFQRIFEPFFTTKGVKSSGLGLASSYGIVKKHHGDILVNSVPGQGTEFTVILPQAQALREKEGEPRGLTETDKIKFLLIDDEINILKSMEMFFEDLDVELVTAHKAEQGLARIREDNFDVILCDLGMDDMNGLEVSRCVKAFCRKTRIPKIPFLLYTGLNGNLKAEDVTAAGVDRIIYKPTSCKDLLLIIQEAIADNDKTHSVG